MKTIHEEEGYAPTQSQHAKIVNGDTTNITVTDKGAPPGSTNVQVTNNNNNNKNNFHKILPGQPTSKSKKVLPKNTITIASTTPEANNR